MCRTRYFQQILMKYEVSLQVFKKKSLNIKFHQNPSCGSRVVPWGQTDRRTDLQTDNDKAKSRFSQFCERSQKLEDFLIT
jgi:hypothetical protein